MGKFKVFNNNKFDIGVLLLNQPFTANVRAGSFILMDDDDVAYNISMNTLFQRGLLRIDSKDSEALINNGIDVNENVNFCNDDDIRKVLAGSQKKLEEWLDNVNEGYILDRVYDIALESNLSLNKLKVLQKKMPDRDFINE